MLKTMRDVLLGYCVLMVATVNDGCAADSSEPTEVGKLSRALEDSCTDAPADVAGDVLSVLSSIDSLDPAEPQEYGSDACGGVVFEFDNQGEEPLHGAWVQASGASGSESDVLSESRCAERSLQADYWGYKDRAWTRLAAADESAVFAEDASGAGNCKLDALLLQDGTFEKLRVVARVTQELETYPMTACVW